MLWLRCRCRARRRRPGLQAALLRLNQQVDRTSRRDRIGGGASHLDSRGQVARCRRGSRRPRLVTRNSTLGSGYSSAARRGSSRDDVVGFVVGGPRADPGAWAGPCSGWRATRPRSSGAGAGRRPAAGQRAERAAAAAHGEGGTGAGACRGGGSAFPARLAARPARPAGAREAVSPAPLFAAAGMDHHRLAQPLQQTLDVGRRLLLCPHPVIGRVDVAPQFVPDAVQLPAHVANVGS